MTIALCLYLRQGHREVFSLIHEKRLYSALLDNLIPLMEVDTKVHFHCMPITVNCVPMLLGTMPPLHFVCSEYICALINTASCAMPLYYIHNM